MRAAIYARYSTDQQRDASIEDQVRLCRERIEREGWGLVQTYADRKLTGSTMLRPGVQALPLGLEPAALAAEVVGGLEEGDAVTGVAEQHGRGQPPDPPADDDDAAHGYSPKNSATVSCTPATAPAT